jgi:predicted nucleic acid-binding protein
MAKVLLDTDILSEYLKGHDPVVARRASRYARQHEVFTFTSVTVHEIVFGLEFKGASMQMAKALAWLRRTEEITPSAADFVDAAFL